MHDDDRTDLCLRWAIIITCVSLSVFVWLVGLGILIHGPDCKEQIRAAYEKGASDDNGFASAFEFLSQPNVRLEYVEQDDAN